MATLSSTPTKITPFLPCNFDPIDHQKPPWKLQEAIVDSSSSFPNLVFAPLPCRSALQSKRGVAKRSNGKKRETIETIVGNFISRAVAFSGNQFRAVLKSFQDLSARKNASLGDFRCNNAGPKHPSSPIDNGNGDGGGGGESGSQGEGKSGDNGSNNPALIGPVWRRAQKDGITRGRTVLLRAANQRQIYDYATGVGGSRAWEGIAARVLMEPVVADTMLQVMLVPFQVFFLLLCPEFADQIGQFLMTMFLALPVVAVVILWLIWRWWMTKNAPEIDDGDN